MWATGETVAMQPDPPELDFEEIYEAGTRGGGIPWDIGEPQPALAALVSAGWCRGTVLDIGCGTGDLGLAVAARGHAVTGVDRAPGAIERAAQKAVERGLEVEFRVEDATDLDESYDERFDTVLDSGLLHCLQPSAQRRYVRVLTRVCRPGGRLAVLCFADVAYARTPDMGRLSEQWLRDVFSQGWEIDAIEEANILGVIADGLGEMSDWPKDSSGRTLMTAWRLRAHRATS